MHIIKRWGRELARRSHANLINRIKVVPLTAIRSIRDHNILLRVCFFYEVCKEEMMKNYMRALPKDIRIKYVIK